MPKTKKKLEVVIGARKKCATRYCNNIITNYAYDPENFDGRVWCRTHVHEARRR